MLKWTAGLAAAGIVGIGLGYGVDEVLRPAAPPGLTTTVTNTVTAGTTVTATGTAAVEEEQRHATLIGDIVGGSPAWIYTKNGRIIRVTPINYTQDEVKPWTITAGGKSFTPRPKSNLATYDQAYRSIVYSPTRVKYPMKRVGFVPGGNSSTENRGMGEFVRITWDEAFDIVTSELNRIKEKYGNGAILLHDMGHSQRQWIQQRSKIRRLLNMFGGQTTAIRSPDSNEGWHWGGYHHTGCTAPPTGWLGWYTADLLEDTMQNCKTLIQIGHDGLCNFEGSSTDHADWWNWIKGLGIKLISIDSDLNEWSGKYADKWIAPIPGTDPAWMAAVAYVWIQEGTYDKDYVKTHTYGFEAWSNYVTGIEDGIKKTPEWAAAITGIEARVIRALAREWASKPTSISTCMMNCRGPYGTEHPRMAILLLAMQGYGKPGVSIVPIISAPNNPEAGAWGLNGGWPFTKEPADAVMQSIYYTKLSGAILHPPIKWYGGFSAEPVELGKESTAPPEEMSIGSWGFFTHPTQQFAESTYPRAGYPEVKMYWTSLASFMTNWPAGYKWNLALRSPKLEFVCMQVPWLENDAYFADLVLPVTTQLEHEDLIMAVGTTGGAYGNDVAVRQTKCIEPIGESKSDLEICTEIAKRLGFEQEYTEGRTLDDMLRFVYQRDIPPAVSKAMTYDEFDKRGYAIIKFPDMSTYKRNPGLRWYANLPEGAKMGFDDTTRTPSGKIEFESQNLKKFFPDDKERPPVPHWIEKGPSHDERLTGARAKKYPLIMVTSHTRFAWHSRYKSATWCWETTPSYRVKAKNGNWYWSLWINPIDAKARGIEEGDVVKAYNERGIINLAAHVTERARPSLVRCTFGASYRPAGTGTGSSTPDFTYEDNLPEPLTGAKYKGVLPGALQDTMGVASTISPYNTISARASGMANGWFLVQVEKA
jgi:trimethylamine-N-oxide reductase (cytochrome c)